MATPNGPPPSPPASLSIEPLASKLEHYAVYRTQKRMYVVASDSGRRFFRMLRLELGGRSEDDGEPTSLADILKEDTRLYGAEEMNTVLHTLHQGNAASGGLRRVLNGYGIVGFIRFTDCYYLTMITKREMVGMVGGNAVYTIAEVERIAVQEAESATEGAMSSLWSQLNKRLNPTAEEIAEARYRDLHSVVDLSKDFFFSYTYDITNPLQHNMLATASSTFPPPPTRDMFEWNNFQTQEMERCLSPKSFWYWKIPIVHGDFRTRRCALFSRAFTVTLIARRSRHFAGTRYLKRGVSDDGHVANEVEVEQIVAEDGAGEGRLASLLQVRGSIPTYWMQEASVTMPKPPILIQRRDPTYAATRRHFADLLERYGDGLMVLDLVKQREGSGRSSRRRELLIGDDYRSAIEYINSDLPPGRRVQYLALDFSNLSKQADSDLVKALCETARWSLGQTGFFCGAAAAGDAAPLQSGILRTSCVDCLDRTNVAQFVVGACALGRQLRALGLSGMERLSLEAPVVQVLMDLYAALGDTIALQYGGSQAHKKVSVGGVPSAAKHSDLFTSIRRYYSNSFLDDIKQDAINLFLGHFVPRDSSGDARVDLWELESDYYLHNTHVSRAAALPPRAAAGAAAPPLPERRRRVRDRCAAARRSAQLWWSDALLVHDARTLWMRLGPPRELTLRGRFDRTYEPRALTCFDDMLRRPFNAVAPVHFGTAARPPHEAKLLSAAAASIAAAASPEASPVPPRRARHPLPLEARDAAAPRALWPQAPAGAAAASPPATPPPGAEDLDEEDLDGGRSMAIGRFVRELGSRFVRSVQRPFARRPAGRAALGGGGAALDLGRMEAGGAARLLRRYVGAGGGARAAEEDAALFERTVALAGDLGRYEDHGRADIERAWRGSEALRDFALRSTDALGLYAQGEEAHCVRTLRSGPYRGLPQRASAAVVHRIVAPAAALLDAAGRPTSAEAFEAGLDKVGASMRRQIGPAGALAIVGMLREARAAEAEAHAFYAGALAPEALRAKDSALLRAEDMELYGSYVDPFRGAVEADTVGLEPKPPPPPPRLAEEQVEGVPKTAATLAGDDAAGAFPELDALLKAEPRYAICLDCRGIQDRRGDGAPRAEGAAAHHAASPIPRPRSP